jgi:hypothetical protein
MSLSEVLRVYQVKRTIDVEVFNYRVDWKRKQLADGERFEGDMP